MSKFAERINRPKQPHDPVRWQALYANGRESAVCRYFSVYSADNIARWIARRGHRYRIWLRNGQVVTVGPRRGAL